MGVRVAFITAPVLSLTFIMGPKENMELMGVYHWCLVQCNSEDFLSQAMV